MNSTMQGYEASAHLYDIFDIKDNVEFFACYAAQAGEVLDIGAGTGRIAIPLAERGIRVTCIEPSPAMRRQFREKLQQLPQLSERIELVRAEAASFDLERAFPMAFLSGAFDHFLDREERLASLQNVVRHLEPDGTLLFDVFLGLMETAPLSPAGRFQSGDREIRRFVARRVLPQRRVRVDLVFEVYRRDAFVERIEEESIVGITSRAEVHELLDQVDCALRHEFSDYDFTPFREGDDLLIVEATCCP